MRHCGLYVHVPFCETKCGYCDFYSVAIYDRRPSDALLECLIRELHDRTNGRPGWIHTMFIGGGTPTILRNEQLSAIFGPLGRIAHANRVAEFTVEANPATVDLAKLDILVRAGVDRISMGAQSFEPNELKVLERLHSPDDIAPSVALVRKCGIRRLNLDLIFAIPGQSLASWRGSLERAMALEVDHIACYGLTYEPATRLTKQLHQGRITPCEDGLAAEMYELAIEQLVAAGYKQYEISNFARPGQQCLHNLIYWRNEDYIGVGPSAAGYVNGERYKNVADVAGYIRRIQQSGKAVIESERLTGPAAAADTLMTQLRLNEGVDVKAFIQRHSADIWRRVAECANALAGIGLLELTGGRLSLTGRGRLLGDAVLVELMTALDQPSTSTRDIPLAVVAE
jgi:oxygen-independent coproporphyrinogen-3 oxidase